MARPHAVAVPLDWVKAPQQARSQRTLERLLDAAEALIREGGFEAVTVPAVVARASSSVGAFYARFPDKDALLSTLHQRVCHETVATADRLLDPEAWRDAPLEEVVAAIVAFAVRTFGDRRSVMTALNRALGGDPDYAERRAKNGVELGLRALRLLSQYRDRIGHPDPVTAVPMVLRFVTATLEQRNAFASARVREVDVADDDLERELTRMVLAYLAVSG